MTTVLRQKTIHGNLNRYRVWMLTVAIEVGYESEKKGLVYVFE